jgi:hypothetical protein
MAPMAVRKLMESLLPLFTLQGNMWLSKFCTDSKQQAWYSKKLFSPDMFPTNNFHDYFPHIVCQQDGRKR